MFGKDKEAKEFFEVFKKPHEQGGREVRYRSETLQEEQEVPTVLPRPNQKKNHEIADEDQGQDQETKQLDWIKDTQKEDEETNQTETQVSQEFQFDTTEKKSRRLFLNEVVVKQETLIFASL